MKYDAMGLLARAARPLAQQDGGAAFAIYELADNLRLLMLGRVTLADWNKCYVGADSEPFIRDGLMPGETGYGNPRPDAAPSKAENWGRR